MTVVAPKFSATSQYLSKDGTPSVPGYTFFDDLNTGFQLSSTSEITVQSKGLKRLRVADDEQEVYCDVSVPISSNVLFPSLYFQSSPTYGIQFISNDQRIIVNGNVVFDLFSTGALFLVPTTAPSLTSNTTTSPVVSFTNSGHTFEFDLSNDSTLKLRNLDASADCCVINATDFSISIPGLFSTPSTLYATIPINLTSDLSLQSTSTSVFIKEISTNINPLEFTNNPSDDSRSRVNITGSATLTNSSGNIINPSNSISITFNNPPRYPNPSPTLTFDTGYISDYLYYGGNFVTPPWPNSAGIGLIDLTQYTTSINSPGISTVSFTSTTFQMLQFGLYYIDFSFEFKAVVSTPTSGITYSVSIYDSTNSIDVSLPWSYTTTATVAGTFQSASTSRCTVMYKPTNLVTLLSVALKVAGTLSLLMEYSLLNTSLKIVRIPQNS